MMKMIGGDNSDEEDVLGVDLVDGIDFRSSESYVTKNENEKLVS